jgi:hypothetical protein
MTPPSVPAAVKEALNALPVNQSVAVRSYIAGLRDMIKDLEQGNTATGGGDEGHSHGGEKCHADHGHDSTEHVHGEHCDHSKEGEAHVHGDHCCDHSKEGEAHVHGDHCDHGKEAEHTGHSHDHAHKEEHHAHDHGHAHKEAEHHGHSHKEEHHDHSHKEAEHHGHSHGHSHDEKEDDVPAWKKQAMDADPNAAPFGGNWGTEMQVDATGGK